MIGGLVVALVVAQGRSQTAAKAQLATRFQLRADAAASFIQLYAQDVLGREHHLAAERLSAPSVSNDAFAAFLDDFGFGPGVLLDSGGRDLQVAPANPAVVGTNLAVKYAHLKAAKEGTPAVSNVVSSAARHVPVVAFAAPFDTPFGRRVVSGAFDLRSTPMGLYLDHILPSTLGSSFLVDAHGAVVAASAGTARIDPALLEAITSSAQGTFPAPRGRTGYFATAAVGGTPWRLVLTSTTAVLYQPATRAGGAVPWLLLSVVGLIAGLIAVEFVRAQEARRTLEIVAGQDVLTGLPNRRDTQDGLERLLSAARRHQEPLSVLLIDIDHFKLVNDLHGHGGGDRALRTVARRIQTAVRNEDMAGHWGGEEFLVALPRTDADEAAAIAQRILHITNVEPVTVGKASVAISISIGVATTVGEESQVVVARADAALYEAKTNGRNRVVSADRAFAAEYH